MLEFFFALFLSTAHAFPVAVCANVVPEHKERCLRDANLNAAANCAFLPIGANYGDCIRNDLYGTPIPRRRNTDCRQFLVNGEYKIVCPMD